MIRLKAWIPLELIHRFCVLEIILGLSTSKMELIPSPVPVFVFFKSAEHGVAPKTSKDRGQ